MLITKQYPPQNDLLKRYIKYFWHFNSSDYANLDHYLIPVTNIDIIFSLSPKIEYSANEFSFTTENAHILGFRDKSIRVKQSGVLDVFGVAFKNFLASPFIQQSLRSIYNDIVKLEFNNKLLIPKDLKMRQLAVEKYLLTVADFTKTPSQEELKIMTSFINKEYSLTVKEFCDNSGICQKKLERMFYKYTGSSPKKFFNINRMLNINNAILNKDSRNLTEISQDYGYFDQMHMVKDFKKIHSKNPSCFLSDSFTIKSLTRKLE